MGVVGRHLFVRVRLDSPAEGVGPTTRLGTVDSIDDRGGARCRGSHLGPTPWEGWATAGDEWGGEVWLSAVPCGAVLAGSERQCDHGTVKTLGARETRMNDDAVRVLTYNVRRDTASDGAFDWAARCDAVAGTLRFHRPDVVGLQEPLSHQYADLREALPAYEWVGRSREAGDGDGEFCPVGYRRDRFELLETDTFWLSPTPEQPGSIGWDATYPRIVTWARLRDRRSGATLLSLNTHFDHEGPDSRTEAATLLRERASALHDAGDAVVVGGDFNCERGEKPYSVLAGADGRESPLTDARKMCPHSAHGPDTSRTDFESLHEDWQIDHVFVAGTTVTGYGVAADVVEDGWFPSDHLPVVVDLEL